MIVDWGEGREGGGEDDRGGREGGGGVIDTGYSYIGVKIPDGVDVMDMKSTAKLMC